MPYLDIPVRSGVFNVEATVPTYADLPDAGQYAGKVYAVSTDQGVWPITFKAKGLYLSDGSTWKPLEYDEYAIKYCDNLQAQINAIQVQSANTVINNFPCGTNVSVGDWVISSNGLAVPAIATDMTTSNVIGLCESKDSTNSCSVRVAGITGYIYSGLDTTKEYFLSASTLGAMTADSLPSSPGQILLKLGQPIDDQRFLVNKGGRIIRS